MELEMIPLQKAVGASKPPQDTQTLRATKDRRDFQTLDVNTMVNDGISREMNVNDQDEEGNTRLHVAVAERQLAAIQLLASHDDVDFSVKNDNQETALHVAVKSGDTEILQAILLTQVNGHFKSVDVSGPNGKTPLYFAVQAGQFEMVKQLVHSGANPLEADQDSYTAIGIAALKGNLEILEFFFKEAKTGFHGDWNIEDIIESRLDDKSSLLHLAVESGSVKVVQLVLEEKLDINAKKSDGSTALHLACANGQLKIVTILVDALIDMGYSEGLVVKDEQGLIPLHRATVFDRRDVVEHLLDKGGDIEALTKDGMTPLLLAAQHGADNTATLLIERGSDPNGRTSDGLTVLHKAVGNARTLQTITKALGEGLPKLINLQDMNGFTALHSAAVAGNIQVNSFRILAAINVVVIECHQACCNRY
jgi:ankyrin repeat protein